MTSSKTRHIPYPTGTKTGQILYMIGKKLVFYSIYVYDINIRNKQSKGSDSKTSVNFVSAFLTLFHKKAYSSKYFLFIEHRNK